jgi:hypothetical protein
MDLETWQAWWKNFGAIELGHLLLLWWDPIGVYGARGARDEYNGYSGKIARMLREGADAATIATYLGQVVETSMGLRSSPELETAVAERVIEWYERAMASYETHGYA